MQRVRMERQLALAALIASGLDVLHTDASVVFTKPDVLTLLAAASLDQAEPAQRRDLTRGPTLAKSIWPV